MFEWQGKMKWILVSTLLVLTSLAAILVQVQAKTAVSSTLGVSESTSALPYEPDHYGLVYLYTHSDWGQDKRAEMDAALTEAKAKGIDTIVQTFSASYVGTPETVNWLIFLDAAAAAEIEVVAYLWPRTTYPIVGDPFYYDDLKAFLDVTGNHSALIGYIGLHEPLEPQMEISADDLRSFYLEMKTYAPHLLIAHYIGNMAYAEAHRTDGWQFSDNMCDICMIWYYPFEMIDGTPIYNDPPVVTAVTENLALIADRDPDAQLWFLGQSFTAPDTFPRHLRMPTAAEMEDLYLLVMTYPVDGFFWYPWNHTEAYDEVLCDPGMEDQQAEVSDIGNRYAHLSKVYMPLVMK